MFREERETIIRWDETPNQATVFTYNLSLIRKLDEYVTNYPDEAQCVRKDNIDGVNSAEYRVPKRWVKIKPPRPTSELQRQKSAERMRAMIAKRKAEDNG